MNNIRDDIKKIIKQDALIIKSSNNNFFFTPNDGVWIFDFRRVFLKGIFLEKFSSFFWDKYEKYYPFQVGGLELGAIPLISGIVMEGINRGKDINSFFVRKDRKEGGTGNKIEGILNNEKIFIVDDLINSGKSLEKVINTLSDENKKIFKFFTFVNFGNDSAKNLINFNNIDFDYEFTLGDFGLDIFGNSEICKKDNSKLPVIYPDYLKIISLNNFNKFIQAPKSSPLKNDCNIFLGGEGGSFLSVSCDTGKINWEFKVDTVKGHKNILSSPIIIGESIVFGSYDGNLYNINKNTGNIIWKNFDSDWIGSSPVYSKKFNKIYIGFELGGTNLKGSLVGINFLNGIKEWEIFFDDYVHNSPGYFEKLGMVICGSNDGKLIVVNAENGKIIYTFFLSSPIKGGFDFHNDSNLVFFGCFDNKFYSINLETGKIIWTYETGNIIYSSPRVIGNNVFVGGLDKFFYHFNINGVLIKKVRTFGKIFTSPIIISDSLIAFGSNDSYIYFYDFKLEKVIFVIEHRERISTNLIYDNKFKHLYVYDILNSLYKYNLNGFID